jgi:hypothetical protein
LRACGARVAAGIVTNDKAEADRLNKDPGKEQRYGEAHAKGCMDEEKREEEEGRETS